MPYTRSLLLHSLSIGFLLCAVSTAYADKLDDYVRNTMQKRRVSGLSLAILQDGKIVKAKGYGVIEKGTQTPVTPATLFQAGSISKSVAALGALRLVAQRQLALDADVNSQLTTWKVPENEFTREKKVTLRGILSHTAGLTVHGFPGYEVGTSVPSVMQILAGVPPTNTAPIRVDITPGSQWRYSGGGYTVMQQMIEDVTKTPYPLFMRNTLLKPLGMDASSYEQPLPPDRAKRTATGHQQDRTPVTGRWHLYPEMAAAGLWTTPSDLCRFALAIQDAYQGKSNAILPQELARQMLTEQKAGDGLGVFLMGRGKELRFSHGGRDEGFDAMLIACAETGQGAVVMINTNDNSSMVNQIMDFIAREYKWPGASPAPPPRKAIKLAASQLASYAGYYEFANNLMVTLVVRKGRLCTLTDGMEDEEFVPERDDLFLSLEQEMQITFIKEGSGRVIESVWKRGDRERKVPRIGPLFRSLKPQPDPNPTLAKQIETAVRAIATGGKVLEEATGITSGARQQFARGISLLADMQSLHFMSEQDVTGRGIARHGNAVAHIRYYQMLTKTATRFLMVHLTGEGVVTDYDVIDE